MAYVYLLHFSKSLAHAQHYCGWTPDEVQKRLRLHETGRGANICKYAVANESRLIIAKTWEFTDNHQARLFERKLKNTHNLRCYCPICNGGKK